MKIDIGESLVSSYLRHVKNCYIVQTNWKPSGNWVPETGSYQKAGKEFDRIQHHPAFTEIFKTGFDQTLKQTELDVLGVDLQDTIYAVNVTFHEYGINFGAKTDTRNRVIKNLLRAYLAMNVYFPDKKHILMFCSPKVSPVTEEIIADYFRILESDFGSEQTKFLYISNENFRDTVMMETLERIQEEFDTSELFLRSFKLLTIYAGDNQEDRSIKENKPEETSGAEAETFLNPLPTETGQIETIDNLPKESEQEGTGEVDKSEEEKIEIEIKKVQNRIPKWFQHPDQNNSKILITYLKLLEESEMVTLSQLATACSGITKFMGNYAQMINIADKNHGKVFNGTSDNIVLWEPVREFIIQQYIDFKKSYYSEE